MLKVKMLWVLRYTVLQELAEKSPSLPSMERSRAIVLVPWCLCRCQVTKLAFLLHTQRRSVQEYHEISRFKALCGLYGVMDRT